MKLEEFLKSSGLGYCNVKKTGQGGGGCISQGETFLVTKEDKSEELIYVKGNKGQGVSIKIFTSKSWGKMKGGARVDIKDRPNLN